MKTNTEELLYTLLWSAEMLMRPTFRNLTESFEEWSYRNGLMRQIGRLEKRAFLERDQNRQKNGTCRLTERGRLHALGGRDPQAEWARRRDQKWRLVIFDVPVSENARRNKLRGSLRARGFGCLQRSVWITPDPVTQEVTIAKDKKGDPGSLVFMEGRPFGDEIDANLVDAAWDFERINAAYAKCVTILKEFPTTSLKERKGATTLQQWAREEREGWLGAMKIDPLLPRQLLPPGYLGQSTWDLRAQILGQAGRKIKEFVS